MTRSVLNLDLGAGPGSSTSLGGLGHMRRPAQHRLGPTANTVWTHPYTGVLAHAVFYNDGGPAGAPAQAVPQVPTPADLAARATQQPAQTPAQPAGADDAVLLDHGTGAPMTQAAFTKIMARENSKGRRAALRELAESAGLPFDPDDFDPKKFGQLLKDAEATRQQHLSAEQRRQEELEAREKALEAREAETAAREAAARKRDRDSKIAQALVRLGATGDDLTDAALLINVPEDADDQQITEAAEALKKRRESLFGGTTPQTLPPAPSGGPAAGNTPRQPASDKDAINEAAKKMAIERGLRAPDAA